MAAVKIVCGGAPFSTGRYFPDVDAVSKVLDVLKANGVNTIDTAQLYGQGESEQLLGKTKAGDSFIIDTKALGGFKVGTATKAGIIDGAKESLDRLGMKKVDIFYIHAPDHTIPLSETLAGINEVYKAGMFSRFGLSNFKTEDVQKVYDHCKQNNYVLPSVFQGNYSAVARRQEDTLFPLLRELGMAFYAYSPIAGGFLTKTREEIENGAGRFDPSTPIGKMYLGLYGKKSYLDALADWEAIAKEAGCSRAELAYRWIRYHSALKASYGDAIIIGGRTAEQIQETIKGMNNGPLPDHVAGKIDDIWHAIKHEAPLDNING